MGLKTEKLGYRTDAVPFEYTWRDVALYALGVGASDLDYVWEARGPKVLPSFGLVPSFAVVNRLFEVLGGNFDGLVHGGQRLTVHRPLPPGGRVFTIGHITEIADLKRMAQVVFKTETRDGAGQLLSEADYLLLYRFDGGFGGPRPERWPRPSPPDRAPDVRVKQVTRPDQALLYRLSGDTNPLHVDPELAQRVGFERPILHGLCTLGFALRGLEETGVELKSFVGQFRNPVLPGDTLVTEGWREDSGLILRVSTQEHPDQPAISHALVRG